MPTKQIKIHLVDHFLFRTLKQFWATSRPFIIGAIVDDKLGPDVPVEMSAGTTASQLAYIKNIQERIAADPQLRTAVSF